jgi:uncharacterized peroxidase-related enzyme
MMFIETVPEDQAPPAVAQMYDADRTAAGTVPNYTRAFSHRPDVYAAWKQLGAALRANMDARRYELATLAAARRLRSSYCSLAHGTILAEQHLTPAELDALVDADAPAAFDEADLAVMRVADQVAADATQVTQADIDELRALGLTDAEIFDVVATAALRSFFSKTLDGLGALADARFAQLEPRLRDALTVGRPIAATEA